MAAFSVDCALVLWLCIRTDVYKRQQRGFRFFHTQMGSLHIGVAQECRIQMCIRDSQYDARHPDGITTYGSGISSNTFRRYGCNGESIACLPVYERNGQRGTCLLYTSPDSIPFLKNW